MKTLQGRDTKNNGQLIVEEALGDNIERKELWNIDSFEVNRLCQGTWSLDDEESQYHSIIICIKITVNKNNNNFSLNLIQILNSLPTLS